MERTGGCACGAIRFKITAPFIGVGACHCSDCQKASGGGPNYVGLAPKDALVVDPKGSEAVSLQRGQRGGSREGLLRQLAAHRYGSFPSHEPFTAREAGRASR